jgi:lysozyme
MIGKLANLARKIRSRGDASKPIKRVNEALNEALEDAPVVPERVKETPKSDIDEGVMSKKSPNVNLPPVTHPTMRTSKRGLDLIKSFESCHRPIGGGRFEAYPDPAPGNNGLPVTIGWGSTRDFNNRPIRLGTIWTQEQCDRKKAEDMADFERDVRNILACAPTTQGQFDALVSFAYNLGRASLRRSTLMRKHKAGDFEGAANEFARWNRAGGQVLRGLTRRRAAEAALYMSDSK